MQKNDSLQPANMNLASLFVGVTSNIKCHYLHDYNIVNYAYSRHVKACVLKGDPVLASYNDLS